MCFYTSDGAVLCFDCVRDNLASVIWSIRHNCSDGWKVTNTAIVYDGESETGEHCVHCNKELAAQIIESD